MLFTRFYGSFVSIYLIIAQIEYVSVRVLTKCFGPDAVAVTYGKLISV